jgi:preprotein translocase subunit SecA/nephrocystin-3
MSDGASGPERVLRVFVSSTFRDMEEERDELVKRVFPAVRDHCESRGVIWG